MPPVVVSAEIDRPAGEVFAYATDPARFSEWQKGVVDGHMNGPGDAVGTRCMTTRRIGGANRSSTSELVHSTRPVPGACKVWTARSEQPSTSWSSP